MKGRVQMADRNVIHQHTAEVVLTQFGQCPDCGAFVHPTDGKLVCRDEKCGSVWMDTRRGALPKDLFRIGKAQPRKPEEKPAAKSEKEKPPKGGGTGGMGTGGPALPDGPEDIP